MIGSNVNGVSGKFNDQPEPGCFLTLNDNFEREDNPLVGIDASSGYEWLSIVDGVGYTQLFGGQLIHGYNGEYGRAWTSLYSTPVELGAYVSFDAGGGDDSELGQEYVAIGLSPEGTLTNNYLQVKVTRSRAQLLKIVNGVPSSISTTVFTAPLTVDGNAGPIGIRRLGPTTVQLSLPDQRTVEITNAAIATLWGRAVFIETYQTDNSARVAVDSVYAFEAAPLNTVYHRGPIMPENCLRAIAENVVGGSRLPLTDQDVLTSGTLGVFPGFVIPPHTTVRAVQIGVGSAGAVAPTHQWACLINSGGKVVAATADYTTSPLVTNTLARAWDLGAPYVTGELPAHFSVGLLIKAGTMPKLLGTALPTCWTSGGSPAAQASNWAAYDGAASLNGPLAVGATATGTPVAFSGVPYIVLA